MAKKTKKKLSEGWIFAIIVILIPVIVFGVIFGVQASWRNATVVSGTPDGGFQRPAPRRTTSGA